MDSQTTVSASMVTMPPSSSRIQSSLRRRAALARIHGAGDQNDRAELNGQHASIEHHVRRAEDLDVQAVGVVPPVIEGRGSQHGGAAPGGDEGAERPAESPDLDGRGAQRRIAAEGAREDQVAAGEWPR